MLNHKTILITGGLGFIGTNLTLELLKQMDYGRIILLDPCINTYAIEAGLYDIRIEAILEAKKKKDNVMVDILNYSTNGHATNDYSFIKHFINNRKTDIVVHLAAMTGVRDTDNNFEQYINSNIVGFHNVLRACAESKYVQNFIYASSSSIYGNTIYPISLYGATKRCDEILAYPYSYQYKLPTHGLRFFTVYGPYGRPDMLYYKAADNLTKGERITFYRSGAMSRDYTYISDAVEAIIRVMKASKRDDRIRCDQYDIGRGQPVSNVFFIRTLAKTLLSMGCLPEDFDMDYSFILSQKGDDRDPISTEADPYKFKGLFDFTPSVDINHGLTKFAEWYRDYILVKRKEK